jgi:hypothetical protein
MNIVVSLDRVTRDALERHGIPAEDFAVRAIRAHLRQCEDAAHVLRTMPGAPETRADRWAVDLASREPAVRQIMMGDDTDGNN